MSGQMIYALVALLAHVAGERVFGWPVVSNCSFVRAAQYDSVGAVVHFVISEEVRVRHGQRLELAQKRSGGESGCGPAGSGPYEALGRRFD